MRTFVAIPVPPGAPIRHLAACRDRLRAGDPDVKWVNEAHYHITLRFLGEISPEDLPAVEEAVRLAAATVEPFEVTLAGTGAFPNVRRPKTLFAVARDAAWPDPDGPMASLERDLAARLAAAGFAPEDKPFHAHITLGRVRSERGTADLCRALGGPHGSLVEYTADRLILYESVLGPAGPRYTPLLEASLGKTTRT